MPVLKLDLPTRDYLWQVFDYDPNTGIMTRRNTGKAVGTQGEPYPRIKIRGKSYVAHRLIWRMMTDGLMPEEIDHINGVRTDNRWVNLRAATRGENMRNFRMRSNNTSGFKGVCWHKKARSWVAQIQVNKKCMHIGCFQTPELAHEAYWIEALKYHGEFANDGFGPIR